MSVDPRKFEALMVFLRTKIDMPETFAAVLKEGLEKANFVGGITPVRTGAGMPFPVGITMKPTPSGGKRTGYNVFSSERNAQLKQEGVDSGRMTQIVDEWRAMSTEMKAEWSAKANESNPGGPVVVAKKRLSGWNLYMKTQMPLLKDQIKSGSDRLRYIGSQWKSLAKTEQERWNARAKGEVVDDEPLPEEAAAASSSPPVMPKTPLMAIPIIGDTSEMEQPPTSTQPKTDDAPEGEDQDPETSKMEPGQDDITDPPKLIVPPQEPIVETPKAEIKVDPPKTEIKVEAPKQLPKAEAPKAEAPKVEPPKLDILKSTKPPITRVPRKKTGEDADK
jgi:hypothetical protein